MKSISNCVSDKSSNNWDSLDLDDFLNHDLQLNCMAWSSSSLGTEVLFAKSRDTVEQEEERESQI